MLAIVWNGTFDSTPRCVSYPLCCSPFFTDNNTNFIHISMNISMNIWWQWCSYLYISTTILDNTDSRNGDETHGHFSAKARANGECGRPGTLVPKRNKKSWPVCRIVPCAVCRWHSLLRFVSFRFVTNCKPLSLSLRLGRVHDLYYSNVHTYIHTHTHTHTYIHVYIVIGTGSHASSRNPTFRATTIERVVKWMHLDKEW